MKKTVTIHTGLTLAISITIVVIGATIAYEVIEKNVTDRAELDYEIDNIASDPVATESKEIEWEEITTEGVNEELLLRNVDQELLAQIAYELQALVAEATEEERQDPELVIREGWTRVWQYERYQKVLNMGAPAMKPLYLIIYKSPYAGEYEYLCANILYELSGLNFEWTNSKEFLEKFNQKIIEHRERNNMSNIATINITIDGQNYLANVEENTTAQAFIQNLPQEFIMAELNGNEKYIYLDYSLPASPSVPEQINAGDVMLYGDNCLVIFYKTFTTKYSYTKIGHIDNLPSLNNDSVEVKFWK